MSDTNDDDVESKRADVLGRLAETGVRIPPEDRWDGLRRSSVWYMSEGPDVAELQRLLQAAGLFNLRDDELRAEVGVLDDRADAWFGPRTEKAVRAFQKRARLNPNAFVDDATWLALIAAEKGNAHRTG